MALIQCPDCLREASDQAVACPHCGYPVQQRTKEPTASSLDDTLRHLLTNGNKIVALKMYRDQSPGVSFALAERYVDLLEQTLPATLQAKRAKALREKRLFMFCWLLLILWMAVYLL